MPRCCCLFAHDHPSTPDSDWDPDHGQFDGWAEWFERLPLLFLYLIGDAEHLPRVVPCAIYDDKESPACLMASMTEVRQRWEALERQMLPRLPDLSGAARALWAQVKETIATSTRQWLILDCFPLGSHSLGTPEYAVWLEQVRQRCAEWRLQDDAWPAALQPLLEAFERDNGWWSPAVIARRYDVLYEYKPDFPDEVRALCDLGKYVYWEDEVEAYRLYTRQRVGNNRERGVALVTGYGRWLVHPDEGAGGLYAQNGWISVGFPGDGSSPPSGVKDLNGQWVIPVSAGYGDILILNAMLMICRASGSTRDIWQMRSLPDDRLLFDDLENAHKEDDDMLRAIHVDGSLSLLDAAGNVLFTGPYKSIGEFSKKTGLAVVRGEQGYGVIDKSGKLIIPCEYEDIESGVQDKPPRVYPGGKILARGQGWQPYIYSTKGKLLASPPIFLHGARVKDKDRWLAYEHASPDTEALWFSMQDFSIERLGMTIKEFFQPLTDRLERWKENAGAEPRDITREELLAAENPDWMRAMCRIVRLGNEDEAGALLDEWLEGVRAADQKDEEDDEEDENPFTVWRDQNALTVYWRLMPDDAFEVTHLDWKDTDSLAGIGGLPGTEDWHWDRDDEGETMQDGFNSMAAHLERQGLALISLDTGGDMYCMMVTRQEDADAFVALLEQARVKATWWQA
ncbi:MAG: WG repeat-containing protein [Azonexus sp.]|jgi:hypothetical protein|nr:WG repeat-containing protein [Azonexus sp.]